MMGNPQARIWTAPRQLAGGVRRVRPAAPFILAGVLGVLGYWALGDSPREAVRDAAIKEDWTLPAAPLGDPAASDAVWETRAPWGAPPKSAEPPPPPPPPPPVPVAIVAAGRGFEAVFLVPGGGEVRVRPGAALPDGGRVTAITRTNVAWTDGKGQKQTQEFFGDPLRSLTPVPPP